MKNRISLSKVKKGQWKKAASFSLVSMMVWQLSSCGNDVAEKVRGSGSIEVDEVSVATIIPGRVKDIRVEEGDHFQKGDRLVTLSGDDVRADLAFQSAGLDAATRHSAQARANLRNIEKDYQRSLELKEAGAISQRDLDRARTALDVARAAYKASEAQIRQIRAGLVRAKSRMGEVTLDAPIDGVVLQRNFSVGEVVLPGAAILNIADLSHVDLRIYVAERTLPYIKAGQSVEVAVDGMKETVAGKVAFIAQKSEFTPRNAQTEDERARLVYAVKVRIDNPQGILKPGMMADAIIHTGKE